MKEECVNRGCGVRRYKDSKFCIACLRVKLHKARIALGFWGLLTSKERDRIDARIHRMVLKVAS